MEINDFHLTAEYILSLTTQEKIFEKYLYTPDVTGSFVNPFRTDKSAGCTFYYNSNNKLYFVDWAWSRKHYDCFNVVMNYYKCSFSKALEHIKADIDGGKIEKAIDDTINLNIAVKKKILKVKKRDYRQVELDFWNIGGLNITQEMLEKEGIYAVETIWENDWVIDNCHMTFAYIEDGYITQIYFPLNKYTGRRRFINYEGFKIGGLGKINNIISDYFVISKSRKCRFFMDVFDIPNANIITETIVIEEDLYNSLKSKYKNLFYLGDNDFAGRRLAVKYRQKYPDIVILLFKEGEPKDFTEALKLYGKDYIINLKQQVYNKFVNK